MKTLMKYPLGRLVIHGIVCMKTGHVVFFLCAFGRFLQGKGQNMKTSLIPISKQAWNYTQELMNRGYNFKNARYKTILKFGVSHASLTYEYIKSLEGE